MRIRLILLLFVSAGLGLAACSATDGSEEPQVISETVEVEVTRVETVTDMEQVVVEVLQLPNVDPIGVSGDIVTAGSSTVFPLSERMAECSIEEGYADQITIDSIGSGAGFERFCVVGESDVSNASRDIKDSEVASCQAIGREPIEFRISADALAVVGY